MKKDNVKIKNELKTNIDKRLSKNKNITSKI